MKRTRGEGRVPFIINQIGKSFYKINRYAVAIDFEPMSMAYGRSNEPSVVLKRNLMKMLNTVASYIYV